MKPKIILLNGPLGIGKSTIAKRYAEDHPMTLILDIDDIRRMLSHWRHERERSGVVSKQMALAMARVNLTDGHDVIVPQILQTIELADSFEQLAKECGAAFYEVLLAVDEEEAMRRFIARGKSQGYPTGFRAGGIIDSNGREKKLIEMYDNMTEAARKRPHVISIEPTLGDVEGTYFEIMERIK